MRVLQVLLAGLVVSLASSTSLAQPPIPFTDACIHAIQFIDASEGWAVGDDGVIWHSIDGGKTWERQKTGTRASLRGVHFLTPYTGWAVGRIEAPGGGGSIGVMLRTTDGGIKWEEVGINVLPGLHAVRFFDEKTGFVCGDGSPAFPSGMFSTTDGGRTWRPVVGARLPSCRAVEFLPGSRQGIVVGAWSRLGTVTLPGSYRESELDPLAGRTIHAVCLAQAKTDGPALAVAVGDGGAVLQSADGGKSWGFVNLGLAPEVVANCDFRCVAAFGPHLWVAGRPGGFVLHSGDAGRTWDIQKLELPVPLCGMYFLTDQVGWLVGELGCIFATTDGGKTWKVQHAGGQRAAVLFLQAQPRNCPLDVIATLGLGEGYLCVAEGLLSADPATSDPRRATDDARLRYGMRLAGGASGEVGWAFPIAAHAAGLPPRELLATWNQTHGHKPAEHLLRQAVLAIRMWQPEVIVTDLLSDSSPAGEALVLHAAREAFKQAADPNCFPEQITVLGLKPWAAKKLYAQVRQPQGTDIRLDQGSYHAALAESPRDYAEPATRIVADDRAVVDRRGFRLVAHRLEGAEKHTGLMDGISLARGGAARRPEPAKSADPAIAEELKRASQTRRRLESLATVADPELAGADKLLSRLGTEVQQLPDDVAARTLHTIGSRLVGEGKWAEAREVFGLLALNYPGHPLAIEAYRWLVRYHGSSETRRRTEIYQKLLVKNVTFDAVTPAGGLIRPGTVRTAGGPAIQEDEYRLLSPEAITQWHQACLDLEPKLEAYGPAYSRDPAAWLCFLAARRQVGKYAEAINLIRDYFKATPGAATLAPGIDPWRDCLAAELWMTDRSLVPNQPKPMGTSRSTDTRPLLDGKLDDACWQNLKPLQLSSMAASPEGTGAAAALASSYSTAAYFAYDSQYLYIAVTCAHPTGQKVPPVEKRIRDALLSGHDRVDILLDLDRDYQTYYRFQIDHRGCLAEDCWGDRSWNPKYFVAFQAEDTGWTAELAIPLAELTAERPSHGKVWAVNVTRVVPGKGLLSWSMPADEAPRPEGMGLLQFRSDR
jgi:photosystem II stability/assembly factor-like uncharacterized protein